VVQAELDVELVLDEALKKKTFNPFYHLSRV